MCATPFEGHVGREEARETTSSEIKIKAVPLVHVCFARLVRFHLLNAVARIEQLSAFFFPFLSTGSIKINQ